MNKKGQEETGSRGGLIAAIVAVVVLVLVIIGAYLFFSGKIPFFEWLPGFNQTKPKLLDLEIFRYSAYSEKIQYYDGVNWIDFKRGAVIEPNGKKISYDELNSKLDVNFFLSINRTDIERAISAGKSAPVITVDFERETDVDYRFNRNKNRWEYDSETFLGWGDVKDMGFPYGSHNKNLAGGLSNQDEANGYRILMSLRFHFGQDKVESVSGIPYEWFDDFLSTPVTIDYLVGMPNPVTTCFIKEHYRSTGWELVVDLSSPLMAGGKCPY